MIASRSVLSAVTLAAALLSSRAAFAFCRATTCDPQTTAGGCSTDSQNCFKTGMPLYWSSSCVTVSVQANGAPKHHITYEMAASSVSRAFQAWTSADCGGARPSINVQVKGPITCDVSEYNSDRGNANIVSFQEDSWPYVGGQDALGITFINFEVATGEIWDTDIEVNAVDEPLSVGQPTSNQVDLDSLLTHEAGHLLGLAHTPVRNATMFPGYDAGTIGLRTLESDDIDGLCTVYPPGRKPSTSSCEPRHGYADLCAADQPAPVASEPDATSSGGCSVSVSPRSRATKAVWWGLLLPSLGIALALRRLRAS